MILTGDFSLVFRKSNVQNFETMNNLNTVNSVCCLSVCLCMSSLDKQKKLLKIICLLLKKKCATQIINYLQDCRYFF
jgi:hypothetical protein